MVDETKYLILFRRISIPFAMKKIIFPVLFCLPLGCFAQIFAEESALQKSRFNTSEPIVVKGLAVNYSWADSVFYAVVPTGANSNLHFVLRNLTNGTEYEFEDFDIAMHHPQFQGTWNTFQGKIASPGMIEIFSFDIRQLNNWPIWNRNSTNNIPQKARIHLTPGRYEFGWTVGFLYYLKQNEQTGQWENVKRQVQFVPFEILE